jgi:hypothetical protein
MEKPSHHISIVMSMGKVKMRAPPKAGPRAMRKTRFAIFRDPNARSSPVAPSHVLASSTLSSQSL